MTSKDAIKHLSYKIAYCEAIDDDWADSVNIDAIKIAVRAMAEDRKKGEWIKRSVSLYRCSECGRFHPAQENFCPNCGAEMEKADE